MVILHHKTVNVPEWFLVTVRVTYFRMAEQACCKPLVDSSVGESVSFFSFPKNDDAHLSRGKNSVSRGHISANAS